MQLTRSLHPVRALVLVSSLLLSSSCGLLESDSAPFELNIVHVNDHHSNIRPFDSSLTVDGVVTSVQIGGFARLASLFKQAATDVPNLLKLHAGDAITGTPYYTFFKGETDATVMNAICFDAYIPGNHEFDDGDATLKTFLDTLASDPRCKTPVLAANI
ncbi:MAG: metallophosphoesterase [Betaproteobacteria bacterium]